MKGWLEVFRIECVSILRSGTLLLLLAASVIWMIVAPRLFVGDGTEEGFRQMSLHYSLGGVVALLSVSLLVSATGSIARERAAKRLALTLVRPVRYFAIAIGKIAAYAVCGATVLGVAASIEYLRSPDVICRHVVRPLLPSVTEEAEAMYADFMANSNTPVKVRQADKGVVLRILANRAKDRYDTVATNSVWRWRFRTGDSLAADSRLSVRLKFSAMFDQRDEVEGLLRFGAYAGAVSNITQAVIEVPMERGREPFDAVSQDTLEFCNLGRNAVMLRPRRDVELLTPADSFGMNLLRAYLESVAMLTLLVSFGVFLGCALGRPSALFTAIAMLLLSEMAPSVIDQNVDELESDRADAVGLAITRVAADVTRPVSSVRPLEALSLDECIEFRELVRVLAVNLVVLPVLLAFLSALVMPRKQDF